MLLTVLLLLAAAGCKQKVSLPVNATLLSESFGTQITLGMPVEEARKLAEAADLKVVFVTPEELVARNLYQERPAKGDLLGVIYASEAGGSGQAAVRGLRGYLAEPEHSTLRLGQAAAAPMSVDEVQQRYGEPFSATTGADARTHLVYYFADPRSAGMALKLTTSHDYDGNMFALALESVLAPK